MAFCVPLTLRDSYMSTLLDDRAITAETLEAVMRRILAAGSPLRIVLFGSQARGETRPGSDLHVLIVEDSNLPRYKRAPRYLRALVGVFPAKDVVVWTPQEIEARSGVPNAFVTSACARLFIFPQLLTPWATFCRPYSRLLRLRLQRLHPRRRMHGNEGEPPFAE
jgi:predicted nucleotidyltransferase